MKLRKVTVQLPEYLYETMLHDCKHSGISKTTAIRETIERYIGMRNEEQQTQLMQHEHQEEVMDRLEEIAQLVGTREESRSGLSWQRGQ